MTSTSGARSTTSSTRRPLSHLLWPDSQIQKHAIPDAFENGLLTDYDPFATPDAAGSLDRAKAEMALSRYDTNHDGICDDPSCANIALPVRDDPTEYPVAAQAFAKQTAPLGLTLSVRVESPDDVFDDSNDPDGQDRPGIHPRLGVRLLQLLGVVRAARDRAGDRDRTGAPTNP